MASFSKNWDIAWNLHEQYYQFKYSNNETKIRSKVLYEISKEPSITGLRFYLFPMLTDNQYHKAHSKNKLLNYVILSSSDNFSF